MKIWLASFGLLFTIVEVYHWLQGIAVPQPLYLAGGVLLAIASNLKITD